MINSSKNFTQKKIMKKKTITFLVALCLSIQPIAFAHSGGTDSNGCHADSVSHHCHGDGGSSSDFGRYFKIIGISLGVIFISALIISHYGGFDAVESNSADILLNEDGVIFATPHDTNDWNIHSSFQQEWDGDSSARIEFIKEF